MLTQLCPAQQQAFDHLLRLLPTHPILEVAGDSGSGKSTLLHHLHQQLGGELLQMYDFINQTRQYHPLAREEAFETMVMNALLQHSVVIVDDLSILMNVCYSHYPRNGLLALPLRKLCAYATKTQKTLLVSTDPDCFQLSYFYRHTGVVSIQEFQRDDYAFFCQCYLDGTIAPTLDYDKIDRFTSNFNAYQLRRTCMELNQDSTLTSDRFIDYLKSHQLSSNVDLGEVQPADLSSLQGIDDVLQSLEANLIIPLEQDELVKELDLNPKRGILLAGPPGTGKTTIGRALAHRLKSKFFLKAWKPT
jgi:adenylate kinase family enzyme